MEHTVDNVGQRRSNCRGLGVQFRSSITQISFGRSIYLVQVVHSPVANFNRYLTLTCNSSKLVSSPRPRLGSNRLERRTALVARELARYKVDIATLSKTRFSEQGQLDEVGAGYTFFWSGRPMAEQRDAGVAFAIWNDFVESLPCLPQGFKD
ncbi:unnamed protein product [Schistocephalus solidus]|uniref:Uncharacterized protein n=1 Tax=Schistocephalus solidus TaxID=70667 RepID=A0A183SJU0_SCHSO|nr:unnamed protein product [Schistocephalus solidus]